jgi:Uma2 family endonuclease
MPLAEHELKPPKLLTYEDYLTEGETKGRYEIIDGVREYLTAPMDEHQDYAGNIYMSFRAFQIAKRAGRAYLAPIDILVTRSPLRTRQPDVLFVSNERYAQRTAAKTPAWEAAPELVVEVISPDNSKASISRKLREYAGIGVLECWVAHPKPKTVEQWSLTADSVPMLASQHTIKSSISSIVFDGLGMSVADIFDLLESD